MIAHWLRRAGSAKLYPMSLPSHDEISKRAFQLWHEYGSPNGRETEIWRTAERQLTAKAAAAHAPEAQSPAVESKSETQREQAATAAAAQRMGDEHPLTPAEPDHNALLHDRQKHEARAPQLPQHTGPHAKPAESGKPVWNKPHSS